MAELLPMSSMPRAPGVSYSAFLILSIDCKVCFSGGFPMYNFMPVLVTSTAIVVIFCLTSRFLPR